MGMADRLVDGGLLAGWRRDQERRGLMPSTIRRRADSYRVWAGWLAPRSPLDAGPDDVVAFLDARPLSARGRYVWLSTLHVFYAWCRREGLVQVDPTEAVVRPRLRRRLPRPIGSEDLLMALDLADPTRRAVLLFAALGGLRCGEIAGLERHDVDEVHGTLRVVHAKGGRERVVPLHRQLSIVMLTLPRRGRLIRRDDGRPFTPAQLSGHMNRYLHGLRIGASLHQLRHWYGTEVYRTSRDLRLVQELLGHSSPTTTAGYAAVAAIDGRVAVDALPLLGAGSRAGVDGAEPASGPGGDVADHVGNRLAHAGEHEAAE